MGDDDIPEKARPWLERDGLVEVGHVPMRDASVGFIRSVPTMHHAARLFEMVERGLGERGWLDPARPEGQGSLHQRDPDRPDWVFAAPVVAMAFAGTTSVTVALSSSAPAKKGPPLIDPDIIPTGPMMRAGEITVREGAASFQVEFDPKGVAATSCQSRFDATLFAYRGKTMPYTVDTLSRPPTPRPLSILCRPDLPLAGYPLERFAELVSGLDARTPARVLVPVRTPFFAGGHLINGIANLRRALWEGKIPSEAAWAVADAYDGVAVGWGATADEAIAHWKEELFRKKPKAPENAKPEPAPAPPEKPEGPRTHKDDQGRTVGYSTGVISISIGGGGPVVPWPRAIPSNVPGVLVPLHPPGAEVPAAFAAAGFTWKPVLGALGDLHHVLCRVDASGDTEGFTLVGAGVHDVVDLERLDAEVDLCEVKQRKEWPAHIPAPWTDPKMGSQVASYVCFDDLHRRGMPCSQTRANFGAAFDPALLDGDAVQWNVTRIRVKRWTVN